MKYRIICILAALVAVLPSAMAQQSGKMEVAEFKAAPTDLDARVNHPEKDWNDQVCALIKVQTTLQGLLFDTGTIMPTKVVQKAGEVWVYVSPKIFKFHISHKDYTPLRYELPMSMESACVYLLTLNVTGGQNSGMYVQTSELRNGYLKMKVEPTQCLLRIGRTENYEMETKMLTEGSYTKRLDFGTYYYKIESDYHKTYFGRVDFNENTPMQKITLEPSYNLIKITSSPESGAVVMVKGLGSADAANGQTPFAPTQKFNKGRYRVTLMHNDYATVEREIDLNGDGLTKEFSFSMTAQYATVTCRCESPDAEIWVDDQPKGKGSWTGRLSEDATHQMEARLANHYTQSQSFTVRNGETVTFSLKAPVPKMAAIDITSTPDFASVQIDGKSFGETPLLKKILMGRHEVTVSAQGYESAKYSVDIAEGQTYTLNATLKKVAVPAKQIPNQVAELGSASASHKTITVGGVSFDMIFVRGGTFTMGATTEQGSDAYDDEKPTHKVTLSDYYIGKFEVTQGLWQAVMGNNPSYFKKGKNYPVERVSWNDCQDFITKLNSLTGLKFSLPTEAQWEYAARGGNKSQGYKYSGGNSIDNLAWYTNNSSSSTHPVGQKQANELGIYDMSGNVYEWCQDWYGSYSSSAQNNPTGPNSGSLRVLRGGSWYYGAGYCRVSYRISYLPVNGYFNCGLRLVLCP